MFHGLTPWGPPQSFISDTSIRKVGRERSLAARVFGRPTTTVPLSSTTRFAIGRGASVGLGSVPSLSPPGPDNPHRHRHVGLVEVIPLIAVVRDNDGCGEWREWRKAQGIVGRTRGAGHEIGHVREVGVEW
jgi:hypothetical protein